MKNRNRKDKMKQKHHRLPKSRGGKATPENLSLVPKHCHRAYHLLFDVHNVYEVARILNKTWIDCRYVLVVRKR